MRRHDVLQGLHDRYRPRTYLEIGVNDGRSLALSRVPSVAIDPAFKVTAEIRCDLHLARATSDDFFARPDPTEHLGGLPIDLAFIDGMHLLEFALRDFMNVERHADWFSVIVLDDQLPRNQDEAARDRHTVDWAGDVYKMIPILQRYRPDLRVVPLDTTPTGVVVVFGADPANRVLAEHYDEIVARFMVPDPQDVPPEIVSRAVSVQPDALLAGVRWDRLADARDRAAQDYGRADLLAEVDAVTGDGRPWLASWAPDASRAAAEHAAVRDAEKRAQAAKAAAQASAKVAAKPRRRPRNDLMARVARRAPILRRVPGARAVARRLRVLRRRST